MADTFEFVAEDSTYLGTPVVNGHEILTAEKITVDIGYDDIARVTLRLIAPDGLRLVLANAGVYLHDETREALISLGWTPPEGPA